MKLRTSIILNFVSLFYATFLGVVLVPVLVRHMGAESYGLVAFFSTMFAVFYMLDMGLTPMVQREYTRFIANALSAEEFLQIWRAFSMAFVAIALLGTALLLGGAGTLVEHWLKLTDLSHEVAKHAVVLMGVAVVLRWWTGLFRGVVSGGEHMAWLSAFNALIATLRFAGVLLWMHWFGYTVSTYFLYQLGLALFEWLCLARKAHVLLPKGTMHLGWSFSPLKPLWRLGLAGALASVSGALLLQVDRSLLSGMLPLGDFGHYSMAVLVASTVIVVSVPISSVLMPRLARLHAQGQEQDLMQVYRLGSRLTSTVALGGALTMAFCARPLLTAWTGEADWVDQYWPVLSLYAIGNGLWAVSSFVYFLQYARGQLHWHAWGNLVTLCLWGATVWWTGSTTGVEGVALGWSILAGVYFLGWTWLMHTLYLPRVRVVWLLSDVLSMNWPVLIGVALVSALGWEPHSRYESMVYVVLVGGGLMTANLAWWAWIERCHWVHLFKNSRIRALA